MAISTIPSAGVSADTLTAADLAPNSVGASEIAANAVGTSEIATGGVLPTNIAYLGDGSGNLSGTITNQQLHFGTAFTLTDDLTINGDVTLAKVRDDGTGQSLTGSGRTLSGTGTLTMGSSVEGEPKNRTNERASVFGDITAPSLVLTPSSTPSSPVKGAMYYNSTSETVYAHNGKAWAPLTDSPTGGAITSYTLNGTTYMVHTFTSSGTFTTGASFSVDYIIVAGGGSAQSGSGVTGGGGGGAGGVLTAASLAVTAQEYTIVVGNGGAGATGAGNGNNGGNSTAFGLTAIGGGQGGAYNNYAATVGGSGGGGGYNPVAGAAGTSGQGNAGGVGITGAPRLGGGGGGAGAVGVDASGTTIAGAGGVGLKVFMGMSDANSTTLLVNTSAGVESGGYRYLAGGGGGAAAVDGSEGTKYAGAGGLGGGAAGTTGTANVPGEKGIANSGGGAGGSCQITNGTLSASGGSGIVIIRYAI